jgi:hypothetical protein
MMKPRLAAASLLAASFAAAPLLAGRLSDDALALVPPDAASVGMVRLSDLRTSPLSSKLFSECDHMTVDGDAARFLEETRLNPKEDVDTVVVAGSPKNDQSGSGLVIFEGRFDAQRLASALAARGAEKKTSAHGDYYLLPDEKHAGHDEGVVALLGPHMIVAGTEDAVTRALADRAAGGSGFASGNGLGRQLSRVDTGATAWAIVDTNRFSQVKEKMSKVHVEGDVNGHPIPAIFGAMKSVSYLSFQATVKGDALKLEAAGITDDAETRDLIQDTLKGALAAWRLAAQEKSPDTVAVIRKFKVKSDRDTVSISGTLPGAAVRALAEEKSAKSKHSKAD